MDLTPSSPPFNVNFPASFSFLMRGMGPTEAAVLLEFQLVRRRSFILRSGIISSFALGTGQGNNVTHGLVSSNRQNGIEFNLFYDIADDACAYGSSTLPNGKP